MHFSTLNLLKPMHFSILNDNLSKRLTSFLGSGRELKDFNFIVFCFHKIKQERR